MKARWYSVSCIANITPAVCAIVVLLSACREPEGAVSAGPGAPVAPPIPAIGQLRIELAPANLDTIDFLDLGGCDLQITLGKFNSRLGRFASDSQRLLLDLEYLRLAARCIEIKASKGETELAAILQRARDLKLEQLPSRIFNATLGNREFHQFWNRADVQESFPGQAQLTLSSMRAINKLVDRWLSGDYRADNLAFEIHLSEIARGIGSASGQHYRDLFLGALQLEQQLRSITPHQYQHWQAARDSFPRDM